MAPPYLDSFDEEEEEPLLLKITGLVPGYMQEEPFKLNKYLPVTPLPSLQPTHYPLTPQGTPPSASGQQEESMTWTKKAAYGVGHILNDICASMWFSYTLLFFHAVLGMDGSVAGALLLLGQIVDALATPVVGILADKKAGESVVCGRWQYGRRKSWHLGGTFAVILSFPFIFMMCMVCTGSNNNDWTIALYYSVLVTVFQIGWASVQISHLSLITDLTPSEHQRTELTAIRVCLYTQQLLMSLLWIDNHTMIETFVALFSICIAGDLLKVASINPDYLKRIIIGDESWGYDYDPKTKTLSFQQLIDEIKENVTRRLMTIPKNDFANCFWYSLSVCSNVAVYSITWAVLHLTKGGEMNKIGPDDAYKFREIVLIGLILGLIFTVWFHLGLKEPTSVHRPRSALNPGKGSPLLSRPQIQFFKSPRLYQVAFLYVSSRLYATLNQVYMPLYLDDSLDMEAEYLATIPLVSYASSFITSLCVKYINKRWGRKPTYLIGGIISIIACIWIYYGEGPSYENHQIYLVAALFGAGSSITLVTSLCITADLIGTNIESGASVYSAVTFADKLFNGIAVMIIEYMKCTGDSCPNYYRDALAFVCGGTASFGLIALATLIPFQVGGRRGH